MKIMVEDLYCIGCKKEMALSFSQRLDILHFLIEIALNVTGIGKIQNVKCRCCGTLNHLDVKDARVLLTTIKTEKYKEK